MTPEQKLKHVERELAFVRAEYQEYLSAISHDFAGPLRTMTGFSEIILSNNERVFDEDTKQLFEFITAAAADGKAMLDDLRQFSRLQRESAEFEAYDSRALVHAALDELTDLQEPSGLDIQVGQLPILYGDKTQMQRVFYELLKNALLYRDKTQDTAISVASYDQENSVEFRVIDNGIGIPENMDTSIFQVMRRAVVPNEYPGRGMGLAIARKIVHRHGGTIQLVRDTPQKTVFSFIVSKIPNTV